MDKDATFQDILLELMVANETLEKIEKNSSSLLPLLDSVLTAAKEPQNELKETGNSESSQLQLSDCCSQILASAQNMADSLEYLVKSAGDSNAVLQDIRNNLMGLRDEFLESRRGAGLKKLQGMENTAESKKTATSEVQKQTKIKVNVGNMDFGKTVAMIGGMLVGFVTGLIIELTKMIKSALAIVAGPLKNLLGVVTTKIAGAFEAVSSKFKALGRLVEFKMGPLLAPIIKWFKSIQLAGKMMLAAKLGKYLDPILDSFNIIKAEAKVISSSIGVAVKGLFGSVSSAFSKAVASTAEWAKPLKTAFGGFFTEMKAFWTTLTDLRPEKLYRSFLKAFPDLLGKTDPVATAIKTFAKKLATFPAAIGNWISGLKTAFNVGKTIGRTIAKLAAPLTIIMSVWDSITGAIDGFTKTSGNIVQKLIGGLKGGIIKLLQGLIGAPADLLKSLISWFASFFGETGKKIETFLDSFSFVEIIAKTISAIVDGGKVIFAPMLKFLPMVLQAMGKLGETFSLLKFLPKVFNLFKTVIGKIALPLTILLSVFDGITGFIDGFTKTEGSLLDKIVGGLKGMVSGVINGLIGGLLDLLKDGISWLAKAFGFDGVAAALDSFSIKDVITEMVSSLFDNLIGYFTEYFAAITEIVGGIKDLFSGKIDLLTFVKKALAGVLTSLLAPFNFIAKLAGFNITDKVLDLLGLPKTGSGATTVAKIADSAVPNTDAAKTDGDSKPEKLLSSAATIRGLALEGEDTATTMARISKEIGPTNGPIQMIEGESLPQLKERIQRGRTDLPTPEMRIVSPQANLSTANNTGAEMAAYQNQTNELNTSATTSNVVAPAASAPIVNSSTVNSTTVNNTNMPDRTQNFMMPAFGY